MQSKISGGHNDYGIICRLLFRKGADPFSIALVKCIKGDIRAQKYIGITLNSEITDFFSDYFDQG